MDIENYKSKLTKQQLQLLKTVETSTLAIVQKISQRLEKNDELFGYILVVTALHREHKPISKYLIKEGWSVRVTQKTGVYNTPLYYAMKINDLEIIKELWKNGASLLDKDANKESALELAFANEHISGLIYSLLVYIKLGKESRGLRLDFESDVALLHLAFRDHRGFLSKNEYTIGPLIRPAASRPINRIDENGLSLFHIICSAEFSEENLEQQLSSIKLLIDSEVDVNASVSLKDQQYPGFTALHFAAQKSSMGVLRILLGNGANPTKTEKNGRTPLHLVCAYNEFKPDDRLEIVKLFLQHGADPMAKDSEDRTPLHYLFCANRDVSPLDECGKLLLSKSEEGVNHTDKNGLSYLLMACTGDDLEIVKALISNEAQIDACTHFSGYFALHMAVKFNKFEVVELLLTHRIDPKCVSDTKITPLHLACDHQKNDFFYPTPTGTNVDTNEIDWLPSRMNHIKIVELLIKHGAYINAEDSSGMTPLQKNCLIPDKETFFDPKTAKIVINEVFTRQKVIMNTLLSHGANINYSRKQNESVLHMLTRDFWRSPLAKDLAELALMKGADVNAINGHGLTPLNIAVDQAMRDTLDLSMIDLLLKYGALIEAGNCFSTPLHMTLKSKNSSVLEVELFDMLLRYDHIDLNTWDFSGKTALHVAIGLRKHYHIVKLLEHGADINQENNDEYPPTTAFVAWLEKMPDLITRGGNREIAKTLVTHVKKLLKLKLFVSEIVENEINVISQFLSENDLALIDSEIERELQNLKNRKLGQYTSLYDILFKSSHEMSKHVKNRELQRAISSIRSRSDLTFFGCFIKGAFDEGLERLKLLGPAKKILNFITNESWPDCCSCRILSFLSDWHLQKFVSFGTVGETRKRSAGNEAILGGSRTKIRRSE